MARQDFGGRENAGRKKGRVQGVISQTRKKQNGKYIDEVNEP